MLELTIDGRLVSVPAGTTLLAAARAAGVRIPTLCHHDGLEPYGGCRVCMVSVLAPRPELAASCTRPAEAGMVVDSRTLEARRARRLALEVLLGRCPDSASADVRNLAAAEGVTVSRFPAELGESPCVLCGRCVRVCREAIGAAVLGFAGRGGERRVTTPFGLPSEACVGCGACGEVCPTGAIRIEERRGTRFVRPWDTALELEPCPDCGVPFAPRALALLAERFPDVGEGWSVCPDCRRRRTALQWVREAPGR